MWQVRKLWYFIYPLGIFKLYKFNLRSGMSEALQKISSSDLLNEDSMDGISETDESAYNTQLAES